MKIYIVNQPFMSREGQFEKGKHTLCIGLEVQSFKKDGEYRVYIGKNRKDYYDMTYAEGLEVYRKHGDKALWKKNGKRVLILPIKYFRHGQSKYSEEKEQQKEFERSKKNSEVQTKLF